MFGYAGADIDCSCTVSFTNSTITPFILCSAQVESKVAPVSFGPGCNPYNDRPCCVEIFKVSLIVTEV